MRSPKVLIYKYIGVTVELINPMLASSMFLYLYSKLIDDNSFCGHGVSYSKEAMIALVHVKNNMTNVLEDNKTSLFSTSQPLLRL